MKKGNRKLTLVLIIESLIIFVIIFRFTDLPFRLAQFSAGNRKTETENVPSPFYYNFKVLGVLQETSSADKSPSPYWWLNSGGYLFINNGSGKTARGELPSLSLWRIAYARSSPKDTEEGYHPQNIFRLFTRKSWLNFRQEAYFRIIGDNLSSSENRNASNGIFLMNRFDEQGNLYYVGLRVDGNAVIKKKINGDYHTLSLDKIFDGYYDRELNPSLLPKEQWFGLRSEVTNNLSGSVTIKFYIDQNETGEWKFISMAIDSGTTYGGPPINALGLAGIRSDFMDVEFKEYRNTEI